MLDLLSDILTRLSLEGTLYFRTAFRPPWGVAVPAFQNVARFHFAHRGACALRVAGTDEIIRLAQGDLALIPHGAGHELFSEDQTAPAVLSLDRVLEESGYDGSGVLVHGGLDETRETQLICGHFSFAAHARHMLLDRLPSCVRIENYGETAGRWMEATLRMIGEEAGGARIGGDLVALKLSETIFIQAIRAFIETEGARVAGIAGFADPQLSRALEAFHRSPSEDWTVERLARAAGLSRTGFAQRFHAVMGVTPLQYLTGWRMQIARQALAEQGCSVAEAAALAGYASESAFSRVFKKEVGVSPSACRMAG